MEILKTKNELLKRRNELNGSVGLVPTMGNLHKGHLSLLEKSVGENKTSILTIFVNPTQFGEGEDFTNYPRTMDEDLAKIEAISSDTIVFAPESNQEIYESEVNSDIFAGELGEMLEGNLRPGHFDGVLSVVDRLFRLTDATTAYFGKKDYQQLKIITEFAAEAHPELKVVGMPIIREPSGLAMSSRNNYLSDAEKDAALKLYQSLSYIEKILITEKDLKKAQTEIQSLQEEDENFNYFSIRTQSDLTPPITLEERLVVLGNYQMGKTRLLDNIEVNLI